MNEILFVVGVVILLAGVAWLSHLAGASLRRTFEETHPLVETEDLEQWTGRIVLTHIRTKDEWGEERFEWECELSLGDTGGGQIFLGYGSEPYTAAASAVRKATPR